ncbi:MAG: class II glutamine amidotransferase [Promethearchaeota archaeon]
MCRLLSIIGKNIPIESYLLKFRELAEFGKTIKVGQIGHKDGWGIAQWSEKSEKSEKTKKSEFSLVAKYPTDAFRDPNYDLAVKSIGAKTDGIIFGHLRAASKGGISYENTHPFLDDESKTVFMHNGTVFFKEESTGNDSRQYFQYLLRNYQTVGNMKGAFTLTMDQFAAEDIQFSSATAFIANSTGVWVLRSYSRGEDYYTVYYLEMADHIIICQEPIFEGNWQTLDNDTLMYIPWSSPAKLIPQFFSIPSSHTSENGDQE